MSGVEGLLAGFGTAFAPANILACFVGALVGTMIGVLPGLGPVATIAILLPATYHLDPTAALIMLAGIYYGAQYGGSTAAVLLNLPGEASSVVTCLDGYQMARQGRAGKALAIAAIGSFFAGCVATALIALFSPPLIAVAQSFSAVEYTALMVLGLIGAMVLAQGSLLKALAMTVMGLLLSLVGTDPEVGTRRMTLGLPDLYDGMGFVVVAMGLFGIAEILRNIDGSEQRALVADKLDRPWPSADDLRRSAPAIGRGTVLGSLLGVLPGGGAILSSFAAYAFEKRIARDPSRFGRGAIEGVAAPEAANNAGAQTSFIPMLTLGIPANAVMALMAGALMLRGIAPGPTLIDDKPDLFWGVIASMWLGNLMLLVINLPLVGIWARLLLVPYRVLFPVILLLCCIGVYSVNNNTFDLYLLAAFGLLGFALAALGFEAGPLVLGYVLGPLLEENFRRALSLADGNGAVFVTRPISAAVLALAALLLAITVLPAIRRQRQAAFKE
ncbi:MAG: tripartite tricarboxylate transporter permease [Reyranellaceae bacterium]